MSRDFWWGLVRDPVTKDASSSRVAGLLALILAGVVAIGGWLTAWEHTAAVVAALVAGGAVPFLTRVKAGE